MSEAESKNTFLNIYFLLLLYLNVFLADHISQICHVSVTLDTLRRYTLEVYRPYNKIENGAVVLNFQLVLRENSVIVVIVI